MDRYDHPIFPILCQTSVMRFSGCACVLTGYFIRLFFYLLIACVFFNAHAERIKDLASVYGVRNNPLVGYGLVVGLNGTGDRTSQTAFTVQSLRAMLNQLGVSIPQNVNPQLKNVAAVAINANLPPFAKAGQAIDVTVSSIGNAVSLRGGTLLMSQLKGADGLVYAIAQGNLVVGGFGADGKDGSRISVNIPSVGIIPNGATVERVLTSVFTQKDQITLLLHEPDFTTTAHVVRAIERAFGQGAAQALDGGTIAVHAPEQSSSRIAFLSKLENLDVSPGNASAKIVINSRTGTVVIGSDVHVRAAAISSGSLTVTIREGTNVVEPNPFSNGQPVVTPESQLDARESSNHMFKFDGGTSLDQIVKAVNAVGAAPGDLISILHALKQVGAIQADLEVI